MMRVCSESRLRTRISESRDVEPPRIRDIRAPRTLSEVFLLHSCPLLAPPWSLSLFILTMNLQSAMLSGLSESAPCVVDETPELATGGT
jgi:hypothetical protein